MPSFNLASRSKWNLKEKLRKEFLEEIAMIFMFFLIFDLGQAISIIQVAEMAPWNSFPFANRNSPSKKFPYLWKVKSMHKHFMKTLNLKVFMFMRTNWLCFNQYAGCLCHHKLVDNLGLMVEYDLWEESIRTQILIKFDMCQSTCYVILSFLLDISMFVVVIKKSVFIQQQN